MILPDTCVYATTRSGFLVVDPDKGWRFAIAVGVLAGSDSFIRRDIPWKEAREIARTSPNLTEAGRAVFLL